jgi:hypothetical protein
MPDARQYVIINGDRREEWRVCAEFPAFSVSNFGRVMRTTPGRHGRSGEAAGVIRALGFSSSGYHCLTFWKDGRHHTRTVHRLICEAWHGPAPAGRPFACHKDDCKQNNVPENLYWGSVKSNANDASKNGRIPSGERHVCAKLSAADVLAIRNDAAQGVPIGDAALAYGVSRSAVKDIVLGKTWAHVGGPTRSPLPPGNPAWRTPGQRGGVTA